MKFNTVCVLGLGYIGLPTACTFATHGLKVVGVDVNNQVIETLKNGGVHIHEPGLRQLVENALISGNLTLITQTTPADAFIIAVPTPFFDDKRSDMRAVTAATESILPVLQPNNLVVLESTSPPQTTRNLVRPILERSGLHCGSDFLLAYVPERVLPGQILRELTENARVIGGFDQPSAEAGRDLYRTFVNGEILLTDATTAEMVKLMENTYRDVNIAIANEFSRMAHSFGVDIWEAIDIANRHPRVDILHPGPGVGGHCIGVDPWFLVEAAPDISPLIHTARQVNDSQPGFLVEVLKRAIGDLRGLRIAVLGLAYKPNIDDLRESPAIEVARHLLSAGAQVIAFEPFKSITNIKEIETNSTLEGTIEKADILALLVAHTSLKTLDPGWVASKTRARIVLDAVNGWSRTEWQAAGFRFLRLGDGKING